MQHRDELISLINAAKKITGSDSATANALEIPHEHVAMWRNGTRNATPEDWTLLAVLAGMDPEHMLKHATIKKWEGKPKGQKLKDALGDC